MSGDAKRFGRFRFTFPRIGVAFGLMSMLLNRALSLQLVEDDESREEMLKDLKKQWVRGKSWNYSRPTVGPMGAKVHLIRVVNVVLGLPFLVTAW